MIPVADVPTVALHNLPQLLSALLPTGYRAFGRVFTAPSVNKKLAKRGGRIFVQRDGSWSDGPRAGNDFIGLFAYVRGMSRTAAQSALAQALAPLPGMPHPPSRDEALAKAMFQVRTAGMSSRQRADALVQEAWSARARR